MSATDVGDARARLLADVDPLPPAEVSLADARGLVLAGPVRARLDVPRFDASAMDGWAVRSDDPALGDGDGLRVLAVHLAGQAGDAAVRPGTSVGVMTGAPLPDGADAVVPVERVRRVGDVLRVEARPRPGEHVRRRGEDGRAGDVLARAGRVVTGRLAGALAAAGVEAVVAHPRPRVVVLTTGDELVGPGRPLAADQIPDSGRHAVVGLLEEAGFPAGHRHVGDDPAALAAALAEAGREVDAVVSTGGVSVGDADHLAAAAASVGEAHPLRLALRPGKPFLNGRVGGAVLLGLPGTPGAAAVGAALLVLPALRRLAGYPDPCPTTVAAVAAADLPRRPDGRLHVRPVRLEVGPDARLQAWPVAAHGSHQQRDAAGADGLVLLPDGPGAVAGELVQVVAHPGWSP